jgi:AraC family transcriptional regulator of adaptative response/methylated-DNA-[protein]-cysteine methyltransferase
VFVPGENSILNLLKNELDAYFASRLQNFTVPLFLEGTAFQQSVWRQLRQIPYGKTASYGQIAKTIGAPTAVRAVARANGDNRICIIVPCHRVIGSDGSLTGYGGGLWRKQRLLELEQGIRGQST